MTYRLKRVAPLQAAIVFAILYALISLVIVPLFIVMILLGAMQEETGMAGGTAAMVGMMIFMPLFYGFFGFITGAILSFLYNIVAKMSGGLELTFDAPPPVVPARDELA